MMDLNNDLVSLLITYIEQESEEEQRFIEDQENCELKLCLSVSHSNCGWNDCGTDLIMIHTRLNQSNEFIEENIDQVPNQFYIKSQIVSHCTGMLITDIGGANKIMSIETIVTKHNYNCETVFKTFVTRLPDGKKLKTQRSFTREISNYSDIKFKLRNQFSVVISDDEPVIQKPDVARPPTKIKVKKRPSFKAFTKSKKSKSNDKQDAPRHKSGAHPEEEHKVLQPMKKQKSSIFKSFKNIFKSRTVSIEDKLSIIPPTGRGEGDSKQSVMQEVKTFSTEKNEMEKEKPTNILAKISLKNGTKIFEIINDNIPFIDDVEDEEFEEEECVKSSKSDSDCGSFLHFDFAVSSDIRNTINRIIKDMSCDCEKKKFNMISDSLTYIAKKDQESKKQIRLEIKRFDNTKKHFINCAVWICNKKNANYQRKSLPPNEDFHDLCRICHDIDQHFNENLCTIFVPFLKEIETKERQELCLCERKKKEKMKSFIYSTMTSMKINDNFRDSFNKVTNHFMDCVCNWISPAINPSTVDTNNNFDDKIETTSCNCYKRRMQILAHFIGHIFFKKALRTDDGNEFGLKTKHSTSCPRYLSTSGTSPIAYTPSPFSNGYPVFESFSPTISPTQGKKHSSESKRKKLRTNSFSSMHSIKSLNDVIQSIKNGYEIECSIETIEYFIKCKDYDSFDKGIFHVTEENVSIENMCLFFYLIRKIVRYIDDPSCEDNEDIKRIIEYSEKYLLKYYLDEISKQGGLEKFILGIDSLD